MSENTPLTSDQSATPKTDAVVISVLHVRGQKVDAVVPADFARAQERRIAELTSLLQRCVEPVTDMRDVVTSQMKSYSRFAERKARYEIAVNQYDTLLDDIQKATQP